MNMKKLFLTTAVCLCFISPARAGDSVRVGIAVFPPWASVDSKGNYEGFEVDVWKMLSAELGVSLEFSSPPWAGIVPALQAGQIDFVSGMMVTPERALAVDFSEPFLSTGVEVVVRAGVSEPRTIAVRMGTAAVEAAAKAYPGAHLRQYEEDSYLELELLAGRVDAVVASAPLPRFIASRHPAELRVLDVVLAKQLEAVAARKGDPALTRINAILRAHRDWLAERAHYWFDSPR